MPKYQIADAHAHIFPPKIEEKAVASIGDFYGLGMCGTGLADALITSGDAIGVSRYLVCSTATTQKQVESINNFIDSACREHCQFVGFATIHPDYPDIGGELRRAKEMGLRGIKLHPDFQKFDIDAPSAMEIYRQAQELKLPILFHAGDARYDYSAPQRLAEVARQFPALTCIAAHFGGYSRWADAAKYLGQPNVYYDTSSSLFSLPVADAMGLIEQFGDDHFMFGTDYPMWDHAEELARFMTLPLTETQRQKIFWDNFQRLFPED